MSKAELITKAKDHDSIIDMCQSIDPLIGCWGCPRFDRSFGRQLSCRIEETNFDAYILNQPKEPKAK